MEMLMEEHLDLVLVHLAHVLRGDLDLVPVLVATLSRERIHAVD